MPKKPPKAKGTRPAAPLVEVAVLVLVPVPDVLDDVVVVVVWLLVGVVMVLGAVGVVETELPVKVTEVGVVVLVPVDSEPPEVVVPGRA